MEEKQFKLKALTEDLRISERQLERIENQNKIFESDSPSDDDDSGEETKSNSKSHINDQSANSGTRNSFDRSRGSVADTTTPKTNITGKSIDSALESANLRALQESLDNM